MFKPKQDLIRCKICKEKRGIDKKFVTEKSLKYHQILTHFFGDFTSISSESGSVKCPKCKVKYPSRNDFAKHFIDRHYDSYLKNKEFEEDKKSVKKTEPSEDKKSVKKTEPTEDKKSVKKIEPASLASSLQEELPTSTSGKDLEQKPLPKCREMQTVHGKVKEMKTIHKSPTSPSPNTPTSSSTSARQRMNDRYQDLMPLFSSLIKNE